ncbi:MAG: FAD-dependent oxidoreductase [Hyphomicrobiaceae bacterium]
MRRHKRVIIVGGGMMGVGLLYHLAEMGWKDVLLIEKGELTSGSTWHAAGQCASFLSSYNLAKVHHCGVQLYPKLEAMTGQYTGWHGCGGIRFATTQEELDWFKYVDGISRDIGFRMQIIGPDEIKRLNPFVTLDGVIAGAWTLDDGHLDPASGCRALASGAKQLGAEILLHSRVTAIAQQPSGEWLVTSEKAEFLAEHVVNSAGCYAREVGKMVGLDLPIVNMQHQYVVTESIPEFRERTEEIPVMRDPWTSGYYRQEQKAGLIGVYEPEGAKVAWDDRGGTPEWSSSDELFPGDLDRIAPWLERAMERMPIFAKVGLKRIINGAIAHTPDGNPMLGPARGLHNFWLCCGSSVGVAQGAGCGKYLAQWMIEGASEINMKDFDARRFGAWSDSRYTRAKAIDDYHHMFVTHLPNEERYEGRPARTSPLQEPLARAGCVFTEAGGFERPKWFSPDGRIETLGFRRSNAFDLVAGECRTVSERVGIADLTSFAKYEVSGPDATGFLDRVLANRLPRKQGGIGLAHLLTDRGRIETEFSITRLGDDRYYLVSSIVAELRDLDLLQRLVRPQERVRIDNVTERYGVLAVAGPRSRDVLQPLTPTDLSSGSFPWLTAKATSIADIELRALRVNYVGELGWELHVPIGDLRRLYESLATAGKPHGMGWFGLYAINSLRMEKAYHGWGSELTNEITMTEAGVARFFAKDKGSFRGREATLESRPRGVIVHMAIEAADTDARGAEPVLHDGKVVGATTSGAYGHRTGRSLAFAYVQPDYAVPGTPLTVQLLGEQRPATLLTAPPYDPQNAKLRA